MATRRDAVKAGNLKGFLVCSLKAFDLSEPTLVDLDLSMDALIQNRFEAGLAALICENHLRAIMRSALEI